MLEWVTSKVVISVAALVILASIGGFFMVQREVMIDNELDRVTKDLAGSINDVSLIGSEATIILSFGKGKGMDLPATVGSEHYQIVIFRDMVRCDQDDRRSEAFLLSSVHLFNPSSVNLTNTTVLRGMDNAHQTIEISSRDVLVMMRTYAGEGATGTFETFIFEGN